MRLNVSKRCYPQSDHLCIHLSISLCGDGVATPLVSPQPHEFLTQRYYYSITLTTPSQSKNNPSMFVKGVM